MTLENRRFHSGTGTSVTLSQDPAQPDAGVNTQLKIWTIEFPATERYTYQGDPFDTITNEEPPPPFPPGVPGTYTTSDFVRGYIEISPPLAANLPQTNVAAQVVAYSLEDGRSTLDETNSVLGSAFVSTDSNGVPNGWFVDVFTNGTIDEDYRQITISGDQLGAQDLATITRCVFSFTGEFCDLAVSDTAR